MKEHPVNNRRFDQLARLVSSTASRRRLLALAPAVVGGRTVARRAEREAVQLAHAGVIANPEVLRYLNRLSSLLFMLARLEDHVAGVAPLKAKASR